MMLDFLLDFINPPIKPPPPKPDFPAVVLNEKLPCDKCVYITNSENSLEDSYNEVGNYLYKLNVIVDKEVKDVFYTLSGRPWTQKLDRNVANTGAPSPNGEYTIGELTKGIEDETGGVFLPYEPNFETERSSLGFHIDPSWGQPNGEDGTIGCHAFSTESEFNDFLTLIQYNNITKLIIDYEGIKHQITN